VLDKADRVLGTLAGDSVIWTLLSDHPRILESKAGQL
jgi:arginine repressor